jgi:hypothetical protein
MAAEDQSGRRGKVGNDVEDGPENKSHGPRDPSSLFPPYLREEFETLRKSERKILRALKEPEAAKRFAEDPARALQQLDIEVPPLLKGRLVANRPVISLPSDRRFRLPNGQVVTAHVKVRFTRGKEA